MDKVYTFKSKLQFSCGVAENTHPDTIKKLIVGCIAVRKAPLEMDKTGIDYIGTLRGGAEVMIDMKTREPGCKKFWKFNKETQRVEPEVSLEIWSGMPCEKKPSGKTGWTLDESKLTDYTVHVFDTNDTNEVFLLPFQILRMVFRENLETWRKQYRVAIQNSGTHKSQCMFVPAHVVLEAIKARMRSVMPEIEYADDGDPAFDSPSIRAEVAKVKACVSQMLPGIDW